MSVKTDTKSFVNTVQKLNYIHNDPVAVGIVEKAEDDVYGIQVSHQLEKNERLLEVLLLYS